MINLPDRSIIGHRGAAGLYPENTLAALEGAHQLGLSWVEIDVMLTHDDVPILFHDDTLERQTGIKKYILLTDFADLLKEDIGSWFDPRFKNTRIPSLDEALACIMRLNLGLNLELKPCIANDKLTVDLTIQALRNVQFPVNQLLIASFSLLAIEEARKWAPDYAYCWNAFDIHSLRVGLNTDIPWYGVAIDNKDVSIEIIQELLNRGLAVMVYAVKNLQRAEELFNMGVKAVYMDNPTA